MQSTEIIVTGALAVTLGAAALHHQLTRGSGRFETLISFCGVALVASGLAVVRDGVEGSRRILWMLPEATGVATHEAAWPAAEAVPPLRTAVSTD